MEGRLTELADMIRAHGSFVLPELNLSFYSNKTPVLLSRAKRIPVTACCEKDGVLQLTSGGKLLKVAVNPDADMAESLENGDVSALMVVLEPAGDLLEQLAEGTCNKLWLYNQYAHKLFGQFMKAADCLSATGDGKQCRVPDCPIQARVYQGRPYALVEEDCRECMFCIDCSESGKIYCTGRNRMAVPEDFSRSSEERKAQYDEFLQPDKTGSVAAGLCPYCGAKLQEKQGEKGKFLSCSHYPFCYFTAERQPDGTLWFNF